MKCLVDVWEDVRRKGTIEVEVEDEQELAEYVRRPSVQAKINWYRMDSEDGVQVDYWKELE